MSLLGGLSSPWLSMKTFSETVGPRVWMSGLGSPGWGEQEPPVPYWEEGVGFSLLCLRQLEAKLSISIGYL